MFNFLKSRKFRQGSVATAITALVIALLVVFNMVVTTLSERYSLSLDLTPNKIFGISEETKTFLSSLDKDVDIFVLNTEEGFTSGGEYFIQANEVIKKYAQQSSRVKVQYIDLVRNPGFSTRYPDLQLSTSSILVACGDKTADITPYDLYNIETDMYYGPQILSSKAEQTMTSALLRVTSDKLIRVSVLTGHNETELAGLTSLLELNNYEVVEQNLMTEEIDPDSTIAVMNAPMRDLTEDELKKLDNYLNDGGKFGKTLFYLASAAQPGLPLVSAFLSDWGVGVGEGVVFESSANRILNMNMLLPVVDYKEEVYSKTVAERGMFTLIPYAKPLSVLFESKGSITVTAPLEFSQTAGIVPPDAGSDWQPSEMDLTGPIPALIVATSTTYDGTTPLRSNVAVCASELAVENSYLSSPSIGNGEYFLTLLNTLAEREDVISIQAKTIGGKELGIQSEQVFIFGLLFVVMLPLAVLIYGIVVWIRRRHR